MAEDRPPVQVHDVGLQLERTALAWRRTALALAVAALVCVKAIALRESMVLGAVLTALLAIAAVAAWIGPSRYRRGGALFVDAAALESATASAVVRTRIGGLSLAVSSGSVALTGVGAIVWALLLLG